MTIDETEADDRLRIGGNNPPPEEALQADMAEHSTPIDKRLALLEDAAKRVPEQLVNDDQAARLSDFLAQIAAAKKEADSIRARLKAPFLSLAQMVENHFRRRTDRLDAVATALRPRLKAWQDAKAAREREEREREAEARRQAAAKAAADKAAKEKQEREAREKREQAERAALAAKEAAERAAAAALKAKQDAEAAAARAAQQAKDDKARQAAEERARKAAEKAHRAAAKVDTAQQEVAAAETKVEQAATGEAEASRAARQSRQVAVSERGALHHAEKQVDQAHKAGRVRGDYGSMATLRKVYDFKVINIDSVPRKYLQIDTTAIRAAINQGGVTEIPGLEIIEDTSTTVRG